MQSEGVQSELRHGPVAGEFGVLYRLWSPKSKTVSVLSRGAESEGKPRRTTLNPIHNGWFSGVDKDGRAGDLYQFLVDDNLRLPDVASRFQPQGVNGPSQVIESQSFSWSDSKWKHPSAEELVIYELHIGTFTEAGTFAAAANRLEHIKKLGANAVQIMPVSAFPGSRNWGYDVVLHFAPAHAYGSPDDLRRFVNAAHEQGLAVIMDVVYNHVCGEPNVLLATSPYYFTSNGGNAWGDSLNFDGEHSAAVRAFFTQNAAYWFDEFHVDGLRLDATHAINDQSSVHILKEITDLVHKRGGLVIAEDDRNEVQLLLPSERGGVGMDAVWADDFHHVVKMLLKPEPIGHFQNYQGTPEELLDTLENGWLFRGREFAQWKKPRGTECRRAAPSQFIYCISNHDQAGNRPQGERLNHLISTDAYRAASMFFLLLPYTPMLFMGQEWAAATPFVFFSNHGGTFGAQVSAGRLKEFQHFGSQWPTEMLRAMPDPEQEDAFKRSKLTWSECATRHHAQILTLYRESLQLRAGDPVLRNRQRENWKVWTDEGCVLLRYGSTNSATRLVMACLSGRSTSSATPLPASVGKNWKPVLSSNEERFGGEGLYHTSNGLYFRGPETILFERDHD